VELTVAVGASVEPSHREDAALMGDTVGLVMMLIVLVAAVDVQSPFEFMVIKLSV
jgi:hypothetical protein